MAGTKPKTAKWMRYEQVAQDLLHRFREHFNFYKVEGKQKLPGKSGTTWEIDAVAWHQGGFAIVECRRKKSRIKQEEMGAIAFRVSDVGANGGYTISPEPLQKGAVFVATSANVEHIQLSLDSTPSEYLMRALGRLFAGKHLHVATAVNASVGMTVRRAGDPAAPDDRLHAEVVKEDAELMLLRIDTADGPVYCINQGGRPFPIPDGLSAPDFIDQNAAECFFDLCIAHLRADRG